MRTLNLGILAHVDAGKTTLTERLLHAAGVIDQLGSVDSGTTQTDSLALERQRGITIRSAVASLRIGSTEVNIIDTPGHPDFIAEVDRVLGVLDGAVLVVSAVEGVQPQTRLLMRALRRLCVPTLIFINKTDRRGADAQRVSAEIARRLDVTVVPAIAPTAALADALTSADDALLREYVEDEASLTARRLRAELAAQTARCAVHPVFEGSAMTGAGVDELMAGLADLLPTAAGEPARPLWGRIFKVERGPAGEKVAYVRMFDGELQVRDHPTGGRDRITAIHMLENGVWVRRDTVAAGQIAALRGLAGVRVGDTLGDSATQMDHHFAPPMLEALAVPRRPEDGGRLRSALLLLAEQDPLINVRADERDGTAVSLYGEVQKEVIQTTLAADFGVDADFLPTTTLCVERPKAIGEGLKRLNTPSNPYQATIGLRVEPGPSGSGVTVHVPVDYRLAPLYVYRTLELFQEAMGDYVRDALAAGPHGWPVTDCVVTMTDSGYSVADGPPSLRGPTSTAQDFRKLTPIVVAQALAAGGTIVCEPLARVTIEVPARAPSGVLSLLSKLGATVEDQVVRADEMVIVAVLTAADAQELHRMLPEVTGGEGVFEAAFAGHRPVRGKPPRRG
ncbi:translation factor GTPase family protein [Dactylosporangium sp. AC04546]|uniref:elongation factor G n=1 Tax=Dactylosporangium sp. AC04546 TaxID=2862460 RepID=UPI001EDD5D32|nr:TetM/TetW/TetO/TetS family tetracycline resistance ribosomal protection protein [Dactylosporangium sp. AC04546]WVK86382.1 translation factor GTPase family protein [Dactylosporangium sp. AC04546]